MFRECEVIQGRGLTTSNLGMGYKKLVQSLDNKFYQNKVCKPKRLIQAYKLVNKTKASSTKSVSLVVLNTYLKETLYNVSKNVKDHSFKFKPINRVEIPKFNDDIQKLELPSYKDKVIQKVIKMTLEEIYESKFLNSSHGFRPKRGRHSALKSVIGWNGTKWFIKGDLFRCFDSLNHHILEQLLKKEISSKPCIDLYWKAVKSHPINSINNADEFNIVGVPQSGVLWPMLLNIYLHQLDKFMQIKIEKSKTSSPISIEHPKYKKVQIKISNIRQYFLSIYKHNPSLSIDQERTKLKEIVKLEKTRSQYPSEIEGLGYRVYYVRHANDFLIGINGPRRIAKEIKLELQTFFLKKLKLIFNSKKTKISCSDQGAYFLGARLKRPQKRLTNSATKTGKLVGTKVPSGRIIPVATLEYVTGKLQLQGICKIKSLKKHDLIPTRKTAWINIAFATIIKKYNDLWQEILDYYSFAYNRRQLNYLQYLVSHSLACTFMNKLKLNSRKPVFKKYGKPIQVQNKDGKLVCFKLVKNFLRTEKNFNNVLLFGFETFKYSFKIRRFFEKPSIILDTKRSIEMYNIKDL